MFGFSTESESSVTPEGVLTVAVGKPFSLRVYGQNLTNTTEIGWSVVAGDCEDTTNSVCIYIYVCVWNVNANVCACVCVCVCMYVCVYMCVCSRWW